jgi:hypothetical protein
MAERPPPLVPPEVDLTDFEFMPLSVRVLRDSAIASMPPDVLGVGVLLWAAAWHQVPAASLPNDDASLARLAGYGRDIEGWLSIKERGALWKFVLCSDGRLYHPFIAAKALDSWDRKVKQRERTLAAREASIRIKKERAERERLLGILLAERAGKPIDDQPDPTEHATAEVTSPVPACVTHAVTDSKGQGQGQGQGQGEREEDLADSPGGESAPNSAPSDLLKSAEVVRLRNLGDDAATLWNDMATRIGLSRISRLTDTRRRNLMARLRECDGIEGWKACLALVEQSSFLTGKVLGRDGKPFYADFDFVITASKFARIMEGSYSDRKPKKEMSWAENLSRQYGEMSKGAGSL